MSKSGNFFNTLVEVVGGLDRNFVKETIGNSTSNNRTLTVNQVIRYLSSRRGVGLKSLGGQLESVYGDILPLIIASRKRRNRRTDSVDINEFINTFESRVINSKSSNFKRTIGRVISAA